MTDHIVTSYDSELQQLGKLLSDMGMLAEQNLTEAIDALRKADSELARSVMVADQRLDALEYEIEEKAITMIARRQPMAGDLREILAALKIASDLERIGDLSKNIAKRVLAIDGANHPDPLAGGLTQMSHMAQAQLESILAAYAHRDVEAAVRVWNKDEEIDALYGVLFRSLLTYMMEDPRRITVCTHLLFVAKNIERIGDHATNIAETIYFLVNGTMLEGERPKKNDIDVA